MMRKSSPSTSKDIVSAGDINVMALPESIEWAKDQPVRRELATPRDGVVTANVCAVPGSITIAMQDRTYVYGYGWNIHVAMRSNHRIIELNKGDVLLSRGDFAFSFAGSALTPVCIQGHVDTPYYHRTTFPGPEMVDLVDDMCDFDDLFCFVWNCPFRGA
ncbi:hypothetical protein V7S43_004288 [Phytophthora oleae]|uniref:Uncharacterized protein n=1 Tax=Phytophthora oleae TaxID=2107226 RepID=A0ABD3FXF1_9STRA